MAVRADDVDLGRDRGLVERFQSGDAAGFEDLYRRYYSRLYRFCLKRVGDAEEAEEVTQEAFTRAFSALDRLSGERKFYPWLSVIAARLCVDTHRRRSRTQPAAEIDLGMVEGGQDDVIAEVDRELVTEALARLGPRHREVLRLREEEGWSYQKIAEYYEVSLGTVEQLLWRARRALKREFLAVAGPEGGLAAAIPALGWVLRRLHSLRARVDDVAGQMAAPLASNAVALAIAAASVAAVGGIAGPAPQPAAPERAPRHVQLEQPAAVPITTDAAPLQLAPAAQPTAVATESAPPAASLPATPPSPEPLLSVNEGRPPPDPERERVLSTPVVEIESDANNAARNYVNQLLEEM